MPLAQLNGYGRRAVLKGLAFVLSSTLNQADYFDAQLAA
jgi:hypothetical protein